MSAAESAAPFGARDLWEEARAAEEKLRSAMPWPWQTADHAELRPALERAKSVGVRSGLLREAESKLKVLTLTLTLALTLTLSLSLSLTLPLTLTLTAQA